MGHHPRRPLAVGPPPRMNSEPIPRVLSLRGFAPVFEQRRAGRRRRNGVKVGLNPDARSTVAHGIVKIGIERDRRARWDRNVLDGTEWPIGITDDDECVASIEICPRFDGVNDGLVNRREGSQLDNDRVGFDERMFIDRLDICLIEDTRQVPVRGKPGDPDRRHGGDRRYFGLCT